MKSILTLSLVAVTLLSAHAHAADATTRQTTAKIAPLPAQNLYAAAVPEPTHGMLLMTGLMSLALRRRRRQHQLPS
ncbi:MAG: hypothetical protein JWR15_2177 [Prosthecobacter sp.]|nr:hypothetical protein [Prosthecobacter sp.]